MDEIFEKNNFKNEIIYKNEKSLLNYLRNTTFYREEYDKIICSKVHDIFISSEEFILTKNAISLKVEK